MSTLPHLVREVAEKLPGRQRMVREFRACRPRLLPVPWASPTPLSRPCSTARAIASRRSTCSWSARRVDPMLGCSGRLRDLAEQSPLGRHADDALLSTVAVAAVDWRSPTVGRQVDSA